MSVSTTEYAKGTSITSCYPWGTYVRAVALCSDGVVRPTTRIAQTADTFFSVPAAVRVRGKHVSGYVTLGTVDGSDFTTDDNPAVVRFHANTYRKNAHLLPETFGER